MLIDTLRLRDDRRLVLLMLGLLLVPPLWYVRTDFALYADNTFRLTERLVVRCFMLAVPVIGILLVRPSGTRKQYQRIMFGVAMSVASLLVVINALRPVGSTLPLRSPLFHIAVMFGALPNSFWRQVTPPLFLCGALAVLRLTLLTGGASGDIAGDIVILIIFCAVGVVLVKRRITHEHDVGDAWLAENEARRASERAAAEFRTLRGIVPICANCKRVRTDSDTWHEIEMYVAAHTGAQFTHGVCPDCLRLHYADFQLG